MTILSKILDTLYENKREHTGKTKEAIRRRILLRNIEKRTRLNKSKKSC